MNSEDYEKPEVNGGNKRKRRRKKIRKSDLSQKEDSSEESNLSVKEDEAVHVQEAFDKVINGVSHKWDDLARKLGFDRNEIKCIGTTESSPNHRCREMLDRWRNREGREATLQVLKQALENIDERLTAESLEVQKTRKKRKRRRKPKEHQEDDSSQESYTMGNDPRNGPSPSHTYFPPVAKAIGSSWVKFAENQLGLTAQDIQTIQLRQPYSKQQQALQALELWRDRRGRKACRVKLAGALRMGGFLHTADELDRCNEHEVKVNGLATEQPAHIPNHKQWIGGRPSANGYSSAIFHHLQHNQGHSFKLESTDVLDRETRWWERGVKEAIYERMYNPTLNREGGLRPTHKKRKTQGSCGCARQIKQESEQSYHGACAESNGANGRDTLEQKVGTSGDGTQNRNGRTEDGHETNSTTSRTSFHMHAAIKCQTGRKTKWKGKEKEKTGQTDSG
ncbi:positive regulation of MHC class I biosynthetic process [Branchiostoma belcheri]|nr:positive regulation of MHC class I biosynthetic process [Branchiostoma belcheri]